MRIVVIGGGPGGYSAAFESARLGAEAVIVERDRLGGTCLNRGCVPTKAILRSAHAAFDARQAASLGLSGGPLSIDIGALASRTRGIVDEMLSQLEGTVRRLKVRVVKGVGRLADRRTVEVALVDGGSESLEADAIIVATGSEAFRLPGIDHDLPGVWTSDDAVSLRDIPADVVIIGGGVIGLEFACAYAAFGSRVRVVELTSQVLPGMDARVARTVRQALEAQGIEFFLGDAVESVERVGDGLLSKLRSGGTLESWVVLSAVGRVPVARGVGLEDIGVEFDRRAVKVDASMRTSVPGVYAIGDAIGGMMLAHAAEEEGIVAARNAVAWLTRSGDGEPAYESVRHDCIPACVYTFPNAATVGMTHDEAGAAGIEAVRAVAKFSGNARAVAEGEPEGFVQVVAEKPGGRLIGCQIVGPYAVEIIHEAAVAIRHGLTAADLAHAVHAHPTASETLKLACEMAAASSGAGVA